MEPETTQNTQQDEENGVSPAEERRCAAKSMNAALMAMPAILAVTALVVLRSNAASGMPDKQPAALTGKHADTATDIYIVDDSDAVSNGENRMLAAIAGEAPYFHKWFGNPNTKAFHHDGGNPTASNIAVTGTYEPPLQTDGCYEVHEWHPSGPLSQMSVSASIDVTHSDGVSRMLVDQSSHGGQWNYVASFSFKKRAAQVVLSNRQSHCSGSGPCYTTFDALRFIYTGPVCSTEQKGANSLKDTLVQDMRGALSRADLKQETTAPDKDSVGAQSLNGAQQETAPPDTEDSSAPNTKDATVPSKPSCMPATIINDFDSSLVKSIVSPEALDLPQRGLEAFRPGRVGEKPYFHDWFGDIFKKAGCYLLQEWHLGGNKYCVNYMPRRVPFHVHGLGGMRTAYADQSTNGGEWNSLGLFQFSTSATIVMSNEGTNDCLYQNMCYTVFDSLRLVHVGDTCKDVDAGEDSLNRMSDLACDESNSLAQLRYAPGQSEAEPSTAEASPIKLLEIMSPHEKTTGVPDNDVNVVWQTEGVANSTDVKISLLYNDEILTTAKHHMTSASGKMHLRVPSAAFIRKFSNVVSGGNSRFRIRIDVQHVMVELSNGWSNQLYAFSPYFTVRM